MNMRRYHPLITPSGVLRRENSNILVTDHLLTLFLASGQVLLPGQKGVSLSFWLMLMPYFVSKKYHLPGHHKSGTTCLLEYSRTGTVASCNFLARHILDQKKIHRLWKSGCVGARRGMAGSGVAHPACVWVLQMDFGDDVLWRGIALSWYYNRIFLKLWDDSDWIKM